MADSDGNVAVGHGKTAQEILETIRYCKDQGSQVLYCTKTWFDNNQKDIYNGEQKLIYAVFDNNRIQHPTLVFKKIRPKKKQCSIIKEFVSLSLEDRNCVVQKLSDTSYNAASVFEKVQYTIGGNVCNKYYPIIQFIICQPIDFKQIFIFIFKLRSKLDWSI